MSSTQSPQGRSPATSHGGGHGLAPGARRWPVGVVLLVALALALAVPLAGRALGADTNQNYPGCGIAPWTGTCTCMIKKHGIAMAYDDFALMLRQPGTAPRGVDPDMILADARKVCRIDRPVTRSAAQ